MMYVIFIKKQNQEWFLYDIKEDFKECQDFVNLYLNHHRSGPKVEFLIKSPGEDWKYKWMINNGGLKF